MGEQGFWVLDSSHAFVGGAGVRSVSGFGVSMRRCWDGCPAAQDWCFGTSSLQNEGNVV